MAEIEYDFSNFSILDRIAEVYGVSNVSDPVNHPNHYTSDPSGVECIEIVRHRNYNIGNAIKYLWRAGLKAPDGTERFDPVEGHVVDLALEKHIQDLKKAIFYINDEIDRLTHG